MFSHFRGGEGGPTDEWENSHFLFFIFIEPFPKPGEIYIVIMRSSSGANGDH